MLPDEEAGPEGSKDNISYGPTVFYMHHLIQIALRGIGLIFLLSHFTKEKSVNSEKLGNFSKTTQLVMVFEHSHASAPMLLHVQASAAPAFQQSRTVCTSLVGQRIMQGTEREEPVSRKFYRP